jgi:outer membrane protein assembly factor BamB
MLASGKYCWIEGAEKTWWRVDDKEAERYTSLYQLGSDIPAQVRPPLPDIDAFTAKTPLAGYTRVAPYEISGVPCYVLTSTGNSALAFPEGVKQELSLKAEQELHLVDLISGRERTLPTSNNPAVVPVTDEFSLINPLPLYPLAVEAAIWMSQPQIPEPGLRDIPLRFGFDARTGLGLTGALNATAPAGYSIIPGELRFDLEPWQSLTADGLIRGRFELGKPVPWSLVLVVPNAPPITRAFQTVPSPPEIWEHELDGPASYPPTVSTAGGTDVNIYVPVVTGQLASFAPNGEVRWIRRFSAGIRGGVAVSPGSFGQALVTTVSGTGEIRALNANGLPLWVKDYTGECLLPGPVTSSLDEEPGDEIIAAYSDGKIAALRPTGTELWRKRVSDGPGWLTAVPLLGNTPVNILALHGGASPTLDSVDNNGETRWKAALTGAPACAPAFFDVNGDARLEIVIPYLNGEFQAIDPVAGTQVARGTLPAAPPILSIATIELIKNEGIEVLIGTSNSVVALDNKLNVLWKHEEPIAAPPAAFASPIGARILIPMANARMLCLDGTGQVLWQDAHAAAPAAVSPTIAQLFPSPEPEFIYTNRDRFLRVISFGP